MYIIEQLKIFSKKISGVFLQGFCKIEMKKSKNKIRNTKSEYYDAQFNAEP